MKNYIILLLAILTGACQSKKAQEDDKLTNVPLQEEQVTLTEDEIQQQHFTGKYSYTQKEQIQRRLLLEQEIDAIYEEAENLGLSPLMLFQEIGNGNVGGRRELVHSFPDISGFGKKRDTEQVILEGVPCCSQKKIDIALVKIKATYAKAVAGESKWLGCQSWSGIVADFVQSQLQPCWSGKFVWRMSISMGMFSNSTFVHHAYAVFPCHAKTLDNVLVLDPYHFSGAAFMQSARIYKFPEWAAKGTVWHATDKPEWGNGTIYAYVYKIFCEKASYGSIWDEAECNFVRNILLEELKRYLDFDNQPKELQDKILEESGLAKNCCR